MEKFDDQASIAAVPAILRAAFAENAIADELGRLQADIDDFNHQLLIDFEEPTSRNYSESLAHHVARSLNSEWRYHDHDMQIIGDVFGSRHAKDYSVDSQGNRTERLYNIRSRQTALLAARSIGFVARTEQESHPRSVMLAFTKRETPFWLNGTQYIATHHIYAYPRDVTLMPLDTHDWFL